MQSYTGAAARTDGRRLGAVPYVEAGVPAARRQGIGLNERLQDDELACATREPALYDLFLYQLDMVRC